MKKLLATLGLGLFFATSMPMVYAAQETVAGTMEQCLKAQKDAQEQFAQALSGLRKTSSTAAREHRLIETFRKRLVRMKRMTPELQTLLDADKGWSASISDKLLAYFKSKQGLLDSFCSTDPAQVLSLVIAAKANEVALNEVMINYYGWVETNYEQYKKLFPGFYLRKVRQWFQVDKPSMEKDLVDLKKELEDLKKEPAVFS